MVTRDSNIEGHGAISVYLTKDDQNSFIKERQESGYDIMYMRSIHI